MGKTLTSSKEPVRSKKPNQLQVVILIGLVILSYLLLVFWMALSHKSSINFGSAIHPQSCLKKYYARLVPKSDTNIFLLDDFAETTFNTAILSDPECVGELITLGTTYIKRNPDQHKLVIRFIDPVAMEVVSRIYIKP